MGFTSGFICAMYRIPHLREREGGASGTLLDRQPHGFRGEQPASRPLTHISQQQKTAVLTSVYLSLQAGEGAA